MSIGEKRFVKTYPISWEQLHRDSKALAWRLVEMQDWKGIVAITRGGLVPASIIARELEIRFVDTICISSYDWQAQGEIKVLKPAAGDGEGMLLIDDLVDTGKTAQIARKMLPKAHFATVYAKPAGRAVVVFHPSILTRLSITRVSRNWGPSWGRAAWSSPIRRHRCRSLRASSWISVSTRAAANAFPAGWVRCRFEPCLTS